MVTSASFMNGSDALLLAVFGRRKQKTSTVDPQYGSHACVYSIKQLDINFKKDMDYKYKDTPNWMEFKNFDKVSIFFQIHVI